MNMQTGPYRVVELPRERRAMPGFNDLNAGKHSMYGLLEVDVTVAKEVMEAHRARTGESLSFTAYLAFCLARAVDEDKAVQAYMKGRKQLVLFDDVNVGLMVERKLGAKRVLMGHVIKGANHKSYREIHQEIRLVQATLAPPSSGMPSWFYAAMLLPWPLSALLTAGLRTLMRRNPTIPVALAGTVGITAVGMFGKGQGGWGLSPTMHSLDLVVGGIDVKPAVVDGRIEPREILHLTVVFDHDVIDGAPAARFTRRLVELIEGGYGLVEEPAPCVLRAAP
jgi:pyruvate/2-oxoglutarate dehydrogenase complex dihydrolipoamide acyltransferase (E2) component